MTSSALMQSSPRKGVTNAPYTTRTPLKWDWKNFERTSFFPCATRFHGIVHFYYRLQFTLNLHGSAGTVQTKGGSVRIFVRWKICLDHCKRHRWIQDSSCTGTTSVICPAPISKVVRHISINFKITHLVKKRCLKITNNMQKMKCIG